MRLAREGLHAGAEQWAFVKRTPLFASLSRFGVFTSGWPPIQPIQSLRSSMAMKSTFSSLPCFEIELWEAFAQPGNINVAAVAAVSFRNSRRFIDSDIGFICFYSTINIRQLNRIHPHRQAIKQFICPEKSFSGILRYLLI